MKYHFRAGRGKNIIVDGDTTFEELGYEILGEYGIVSDHLFMFEFSNGDETNSASPFGPMDKYPENISIEMKIKDRHMDVGETMTFFYNYASSWSRKVKLVKIL